MPEAVRRSVLDDLALPRNSAAAAAACPPATRFILRGGREAAACVGPAFGAAPPTEPLRSVTAGARSALWMGPDEWLLLAEDFEPALGAKLEEALAPSPMRWSTSRIVRGRSRSADAARRGCSMRASRSIFDPSAFPVGMVARALLTKAEIALWRRAPELFRVEFSRSFGPYVIAILTQAANDQELC